MKSARDTSPINSGTRSSSGKCVLCKSCAASIVGGRCDSSTKYGTRTIPMPAPNPTSHFIDVSHASGFVINRTKNRQAVHPSAAVQRKKYEKITTLKEASPITVHNRFEPLLRLRSTRIIERRNMKKNGNASRGI